MGAMPKDAKNARETGLGAYYRFGRLIFNAKTPAQTITLEERDILKGKKNVYGNCLFDFSDPFTVDVQDEKKAVDTAEVQAAEDKDGSDGEDGDEKKQGFKKLIKK